MLLDQDNIETARSNGFGGYIASKIETIRYNNKTVIKYHGQGIWNRPDFYFINYIGVKNGRRMTANCTSRAPISDRCSARALKVFDNPPNEKSAN